MKTNTRKKRRRGKCLHCHGLFVSDPRNRWHQRYCGKPDCREASKAASQRLWLSSEKGLGYFKGPEHVQRVREWRTAHPGYWKKEKEIKPAALQDVLIAQPLSGQGDTYKLDAGTLQDIVTSQPALLLGLISTLTGNALQDDVEKTSRRLILIGQDILGNGPGSKPKGGTLDGHETYSLSGTSSASTQAVQLG